jgi:hypothetical protein
MSSSAVNFLRMAMGNVETAGLKNLGSAKTWNERDFPDV